MAEETPTKVDKRYIPTVLKTNTPMMMLQVAWKCPNCGGNAIDNIVSCEQTDQVTKNFVAAYTSRKWCAACLERKKVRLLDEAKVTFISEKHFTRWARGIPKKAVEDKCVSEG